MDALKANTPEELYQAIGEFLQSDYSRENLIMVYEDARKCANRFPVTYSALPKVPTYSNDPLDGLQEILKWCDKSVKLVDDIVSDLDQQTINETICQFKKLRGVADSVLSLVDTKVKEQAQEEARAKVEKEYANLNEEASKTEGMLLTQLIEVELKLKLKAQAILRRETTDAVQIYLSKDPTFKNRVSQHNDEINKVIERLNKLVGSDTPTGKLLDIYCKLKSIPLQSQFDDVGYAYSPIDDWVDVICGGCNRLYTSIDNVIKTFEEIQAKAKLKTDETHPQKKLELAQTSHKDLPTIKKLLSKNFIKATIKHFPYYGSYLFDIIYGVDGMKEQKAKTDLSIIARDNIDGTTPKPKKEKGGWGLTTILGIITVVVAILIFFFGDNIWGRLNKKLKSSKPAVEQIEISKTENKKTSELKTSGDSSPAIITSGPNSHVTVNYDSPESKTKQIAENKSSLSLKEIYEDIDSRPVFQQKDAWKYYVGLKVKWRLHLISVTERNEKRLEVHMCDMQVLFPSIFCSVEISRYPKLKVAKKSSVILVLGEIIQIDEHGVYLSDVSLEFE